MEHLDTSVQALLAQIWHQLQIYMHKEWRAIKAKIDSGRIDARLAKKQFRMDFGTDNLVYELHDETLVVALVPPRPP